MFLHLSVVPGFFPLFLCVDNYMRPSQSAAQLELTGGKAVVSSTSLDAKGEVDE